MTEAASRWALVGGHGFLGWHTAVRLRALHAAAPVLLGRADTCDPETLAATLGDAGVVLHLAGVNRAATDAQIEEGNVEAAEILGDALRLRGRPVHLVYANSIQAGRDTAYGRGKAAAASALRAAVGSLGGTVADVRLPNVFGEHGRPHYNSVVATFCHEVATGGQPHVDRAGEVPLLHAQDAAESLIQAARHHVDATLEPAAPRRNVGDLLDRITEFHRVYSTGEVPVLADKFAVDLFNTYRSFTFPAQFPMHAQVHSDQRGELFETVRAHGGPGMSFVSTTRPGARRGDHYHLSKIERFFVVSGEAEIALRRLYHDDVVRLRLGGDRPGFVDMPTMWVHNISNVGDDDLVTVFWANQLLDPVAPDQYPEQVDPA